MGEEALVLREEAIALTTVDGGPLPPIVDYDAIFIPESHDKVVLIAPQLAFHEAVGAQLLGASGCRKHDTSQVGCIFAAAQRFHVATIEVSAAGTSDVFVEIRVLVGAALVGVAFLEEGLTDAAYLANTLGFGWAACAALLGLFIVVFAIGDDGYLGFVEKVTAHAPCYIDLRAFAKGRGLLRWG